MNPRTVAVTEVAGFFGYPMGVTIFRREPGDYPRKVSVSTVCLEGGHLEDPLGWCEPESGYETMVFLDGSSFLPVYQQKFDSREAAAIGHQEVIAKLLDGSLPLALKLNYTAFEITESSAA